MGKKKQRTADVLSDLSISKQWPRTPHSHSNTTNKPPLDRLPQTNKLNYPKGFLILHNDGERKRRRKTNVLSKSSISKQLPRTPHLQNNTTKESFHRIAYRRLINWFFSKGFLILRDDGERKRRRKTNVLSNWASPNNDPGLHIHTTTLHI